MNDPIYLLTTVEHIPIIIKCESSKDVEAYSQKGSRQLGKACALRNIESGKWVQDTDSDKIAKIINSRLSHLECWIRKQDAYI